MPATDDRFNSFSAAANSFESRRSTASPARINSSSQRFCMNCGARTSSARARATWSFQFPAAPTASFGEYTLTQFSSIALNAFATTSPPARVAPACRGKSRSPRSASTLRGSPHWPARRVLHPRPDRSPSVSRRPSRRLRPVELLQLRREQVERHALLAVGGLDDDRRRRAERAFEHRAIGEPDGLGAEDAAPKANELRETINAIEVVFMLRRSPATRCRIRKTKCARRDENS